MSDILTRFSNIYMFTSYGLAD